MRQALVFGLLFNVVMFGIAFVCLMLPHGTLLALGFVGFCLFAAIGSYLNLVAYRYRSGTPIHGAKSHCPRCRTPILDRHNIPVVGWLWLRGRCAACHQAISWHYPAVEFACGAVGAVVTVLLVPSR